MDNVFNQVDTLDQRCYTQYALTEDILMEHAAIGLLNHIIKSNRKTQQVLIVCGPGNNGGDGLALARLLFEYASVQLYLPFGAKSVMAQRQLERLHQLNIKLINELPRTSPDIVVDCLFGSGLNKPLNNSAVELIDHLNRFDSLKIACDIPSGLNSQGQPSPIAFYADKTATMGGLKTSLFSDDAKDYIGELTVITLGLPTTSYQDSSPIKKLYHHDLKLPFRSTQSSHKGSYGHLAVITGNKVGAGQLAALAAFSFGCGLVTTVSALEKPEVGQPLHIMHSEYIPKSTNAIALGMGLGRDELPSQLSSWLTAPVNKVIDADLFYWGKLAEFFEHPLVLTPHPKEFCALLKSTKLASITVKELQQDRFYYLRLFCDKYPKVTLLLKGANCLIGQGQSIYINDNGSAILSKGGSGDVLSGLIASLLAQGYSPLDAAIHGSLAHTQAAQELTINNYAMTPQDLIAQLRVLNQ
ncbi:NAD(P)H-hydrate dehydratase [Psychrobium sp. 1_MG-2023]|uniref:NAD(P)H-hydrate dehydratase n=1 Tax=Psychrobium sp. 1_MG-2023 TaxID=3062624 RepID=UPI000C32AC07|nr:NAD(P)H-hydrate dehydratase [Psychrobium sp. 1_MG-2023]MDP2560473.1 NAD(P)H-hydrate dehydratase [Psychrobium sp. 1_MG-2023]PKF57867.1 bifunctional ADP-dependent NAD(P)H-hydrate dehydratase/NAD(P)H-hydrate epimerase [Alteromonadales bacterium alter-6D02]